MASPRLAQETPIPLFINGKLLTNILCTPENLKHLAIGWLLGQGIIRRVDHIRAIAVCGGLIDITLVPEIKDYDSKARFRHIETSGCGGGQMNALQYCCELDPVVSDLSVTLDQCRQALSAMFRKLEAATLGPGLHCAAILIPVNHEIIVFGYDIGRHNAVDKAVGEAIIRSVNLSETLLATSGRISSDMIIKVASAGIPIVTSPRSVTTLASELAEQAGIAIAGSLRKDDPVLCGNVSRLR